MTNEAIDDTSSEMPDELTLLKNRAKMLGIKFHPSSGIDVMKEKIKQHMSGEKAVEPVKEPEVVEPVLVPVRERTKADIRQEQFNAANKLVRVEISCMNPNKKEWQGEIFAVSNGVIGTIKKFVAFNVPYHVPQAILNMIEERKCQIFHNVKDSKGNTIRKGKLIREFAINKLDPLTPSELKSLAAKQAASAGQVE